MANCFPAPDPLQSQFFIPVTNLPGNGVKVFCYLNFTTTKQSVFKYSAGASAFTNPIILDADGNLPINAEMYIQTGKTMTFVYAPSNDTDPPSNPYRQLNDIQGINDPLVVATSSVFSTEWVVPSAGAAFVTASSFTLPGDFTAPGQADSGRRIKAQVTAGTVYGYIHDASISASSTLVNIIPDIGQALDSGLSSLSWGLLSAKNASMPYGVSRGWELPLAVASSTPIYTSGISENILLTSTAVTITQFDGGYPGMIRFVRASTGGFTIQHNATSIICPTGSSIAVAQNDHFTALALTSSITFIKTYSRFSGLALNASLSGVPQRLFQTSFTAQAQIDVSFSTTPFTAYRDLKIKLRGIYPSANISTQVIAARTSFDGGVTFNSAVSSYICLTFIAISARPAAHLGRLLTHGVGCKQGLTCH